MSKRVLLILGNYYPEPTGIGKYNGEMVDWLSTRGYECTVVTTYPYYPFWKIQEPYTNVMGYKGETKSVSPTAVPIEIIRCPHYVPENPTGIGRVLSDLSFFLSAFFIVVKFLFRKKYNYVVTVAPPFQIGLMAILYKNIRGAKFLYHIQDLQIDAAKDLKMIKSAFIINCLLSMEKYILRNADNVSTISLGMMNKVVLKCNKHVILCPNWVDTAVFYPLANNYQQKVDFGFDIQDKIVLYSGAIGEKQGLESILYAAKAFEENARVKFVICGSGPYKEKLQMLTKTLNLVNVNFYPLQPFNKFNDFLNIADVHLVLQKANASDLVMPSKLTTILSVGALCIVTACKGTSLYDIVSSHNLGILAEPENHGALTEAIERALTLNDPEIRKNARAYAEKNLAIEQILSKMERVFFDHKVASQSPVKGYSHAVIK